MNSLETLDSDTNIRMVALYDNEEVLSCDSHVIGFIYL